MMTEGRLITFEGIEGSGKSTQAALLYEYLIGSGIGTILLREPGGTESGEKIREIVLNSPPGKLGTNAELFLFLAARAQLIDERVGPALRSGTVVLLDRYIHSTLAYQCYGSGISWDGRCGLDNVIAIRELCRKAARGRWPDLVLLVDVPVEVGLSRIAARERDGIENRGEDFHCRVRAGFLELARMEPETVKIVDGTRPRDVVAAEITAIVGAKPGETK